MLFPYYGVSEARVRRAAQPLCQSAMRGKPDSTSTLLQKCLSQKPELTEDEDIEIIVIEHGIRVKSPVTFPGLARIPLRIIIIAALIYSIVFIATKHENTQILSPVSL